MFTYIFHVITLFAFSSNLVDTNVNMELFLFEKTSDGDVKLSPNINATSATSVFDCCTTCSNMADCGSVNYKSRYDDNNCELISSEINASQVNMQLGWNIYMKNEASVCHTNDWITERSSCYRLETDLLTWNEAQAKCAAHTNGHLVHIWDAEEDQLIQTIYELQKTPSDQPIIWIGLSDLDTPGIHKWTDGSLVTNYKNWGTNQHLTDNGEQCMMVYGPDGFTWHDNNCITPLISVCEIDIV